MALRNILISFILLVIFGANYCAHGSIIENSEILNTTVNRTIVEDSRVRESSLKLTYWLNSVGYIIVSENTIVKDSSVIFSRLSLRDCPGTEFLLPEDAFGSGVSFPFNRVQNSHISGSSVGSSTRGVSCGRDSDNSTSVRSWVLNSSLQGSLATDSGLNLAFVCGSQLTSSSLFSSNATRSTLTDSLVIDRSSVTDSQIESSQVKRSILTGSVIKNSRVKGNVWMLTSSLQGSLATESALYEAFVYGSHLTSSSLFWSNATRSVLTDSKVSVHSNVIDSQIENSVLTGCVIKNSTVKGKVLNNVIMTNNVIEISE